MKTRDSKWLALVSVVLTGLTLGCSVSRPPAKPSDIVKEYFHHLTEGEFEAAAKLISAQPAAQMSWRWLKEIDLEAKTAIKEAGKEKGGVKTIETMTEDIVGESAKVALTTIYNNGQADTSFFRLVKENGMWKIEDEGAWGKPLPIFPPLK